MIRNLIGIIIIIAAIVFGIWAGVWWAFIGGIVDVIDGIKATPVEAMSIAIGIAKVWFAAVIGGIAFWIGAVIGAAFIGS